MIGFSIMMWFLGFILLCVSISLLRGNTSSLHGNTFEMTDDKVGYAKSSGCIVLLLMFVFIITGFVPLFIPAGVFMNCAIGVLVVLILLCGFLFCRLQRRFGKKSKK